MGLNNNEDDVDQSKSMKLLVNSNKTLFWLTSFYALLF